MDRYEKISKYRKQLEYIERIFNILIDDNDGGLYDDFTEYDRQNFTDFATFMNEVQMCIEHKLKNLEVQNENLYH